MAPEFTVYSNRVLGAANYATLDPEANPRRLPPQSVGDGWTAVAIFDERTDAVQVADLLLKDITVEAVQVLIGSQRLTYGRGKYGERFERGV